MMLSTNGLNQQPAYRGTAGATKLAQIITKTFLGVGRGRNSSKITTNIGANKSFLVKVDFIFLIDHSKLNTPKSKVS
jgi:hypothetical protein